MPRRLTKEKYLAKLAEVDEALRTHLAHRNVIDPDWLANAKQHLAQVLDKSKADKK